MDVPGLGHGHQGAGDLHRDGEAAPEVVHGNIGVDVAQQLAPRLRDDHAAVHAEVVHVPAPTQVGRGVAVEGLDLLPEDTQVAPIPQGHYVHLEEALGALGLASVHLEAALAYAHELGSVEEARDRGEVQRIARRQRVASGERLDRLDAPKAPKALWHGAHRPTVRGAPRHERLRRRSRRSRDDGAGEAFPPRQSLRCPRPLGKPILRPLGHPVRHLARRR
mmetsp:Transcript_97981/g.272627  ORF Transcript_97981/g.272627 Transcript_97981/m.272627 type:complete len:221 (+) Transcript_97981:771-1433(+)